MISVNGDPLGVCKDGERECERKDEVGREKDRQIERSMTNNRGCGQTETRSVRKECDGVAIWCGNMIRSVEKVRCRGTVIYGKIMVKNR